MHPPADRNHWPDELRLLLGQDADELLGAYVRHLGGELVSTQPRQIVHRPSRSTTVQYRTDVSWPTGHSTTETYVVSCGGRPVEGATVLADGALTASVWNWRDDPALPGLRAALDVRHVTQLFRDLGIEGGAVRLRARAYRPGRRAVVEATDDHRRLFLKVVRPDRVEALHDVHRDLAACMLVPNSVGWTDGGLIVLPAVAGETMRDALRRDDATLPEPAAVTEMLDALPRGVGRTTARDHWLDEARRHASVIESTVPAARPVLRRTLARMEHLADPDDQYDEVTVHGDLYEAQVMIDGSRIAGLLDIDTVGVGQRIDDLANFCAHLSVLATVWPSARRINRYGAALLAHAEQRFERRGLRVRIAAATLGLATGPFRTLESNWSGNTVARLELADRWLDGAAHRRSA